MENVLKDKGFAGDNLEKRIETALGSLPQSASEGLDAIRHIGNYAVHPTKVQQTGVIVDVEPEEAEFALDVLDDLFEALYVQPVRNKERCDRINEKLKRLGKPQLKKATGASVGEL